MLQVFNIPEGAAAAAREPPWHFPAMAQAPQPPHFAPQEDMPAFLSLTIDRIMSATMTISPALISIVPIFFSQPFQHCLFLL